MIPPAERFQADGYHFQVYKNRLDDGWTAIAKTIPFEHFGKPLYESGTLWFEFGSNAEEAYTHLRLSMGLEVVK